MRLHDAAGGVTAETLQHVYDLVSQHVSQQTRHYGRVRRFPHAIVEKHDARPLEWHSIGKCAGMPVLRGGEGDRDHDSVPCGDAEALVISPLQPYARLRKKLCGYFPTRIDGRRVRSGIETNHHHPLGDAAIACPSTRPNCQHRCNTQKPHGVLSSCRGKRKGRRKGATLVADFVIALRSEEHTSELQSLRHLVCRLLLEKKKKLDTNTIRRAYLARSALPRAPSRRR